MTRSEAAAILNKLSFMFFEIEEYGDDWKRYEEATDMAIRTLLEKGESNDKRGSDTRAERNKHNLKVVERFY